MITIGKKTSLLFIAPVAIWAAQAVAGDAYPASPKAVVEAYVLADSTGDAMQGKTWANVQKYTTWPASHSWDGCLVVKTHDVGAPSEAGGKTQVTVTYDVIGEFDGVRMALAPRKDQLTLELAQQGGQWKIGGEPAKPRLSPQAALPLLKDALEQAKAMGDDVVKAQIEESIAALK